MLKKISFYLSRENKTFLRGVMKDSTRFDTMASFINAALEEADTYSFNDLTLTKVVYPFRSSSFLSQKAAKNLWDIWGQAPSSTISDIINYSIIFYKPVYESLEGK